MKTTYKLLIGVCALMLFATSCTDTMPYAEEEYNNTYLYLPYNITIKDGETSGDFTVNCNGEWWIYSSPYWVNLDQYSGSGYTSIHFTVDEYTGTSNRWDYLRVKTYNGMKEDEIRITQEPTTPFKAYMNTTTDYKAEGGSELLYVEASSIKSWTVTRSDTWVHFSYSTNTSSSYTGKGKSFVSIYVDENPNSSSRSSTLVVRCGTKTELIRITQEPATTFRAYMATTDYKAEGDWWTLNVETAASKNWTVTRSDTWVHFSYSTNTSSSYTGKGNASVRIYVDENPYSSSRSSTLRVTCGTKTESITIRQAGQSSSTLAVSSSYVVLGWDATTNTNTFTITSSTSWRITKSSGSSWLTVSPSSGTGNKTITLSAPYYTDLSGRDATLTITTTSGTTVTKTVSVHQY